MTGNKRSRHCAHCARSCEARQSRVSSTKRNTMWRVLSSASKRLGLSAFSASHTDSGIARIASRMPLMSTLPSSRTEVVLRGLGWIASACMSEPVAEQVEVAPVQVRNAIDQLLVVILPVIAATRAVDLLERPRRDADPGADCVIGDLHLLHPADVVAQQLAVRIDQHRVLWLEQDVLHGPQFVQDVTHHLLRHAVEFAAFPGDEGAIGHEAIEWIAH